MSKDFKAGCKNGKKSLKFFVTKKFKHLKQHSTMIIRPMRLYGAEARKCGHFKKGRRKILKNRDEKIKMDYGSKIN
jgi:hypothetical protein